MSWPCEICAAANRDDAARNCTAEAVGCTPLNPVPCAGLAEMAAELVIYQAAKATRSRGATEVVN